MVRPYKRLLGLPDYRQQTLEAYLKTGRTEEQSGKDLIRTYKQYIANPCQELLEPVLQHNQADLEGLAGILPVMSYQYLSRSTVRVRKAQANYYRDPAGKQAEELLLHFSLDIHVPVPLYCSLDGCHIKIEGDRGLLKVPLYNEVMKYFYAFINTSQAMWTGSTGSRPGRRPAIPGSRASFCPSGRTGRAGFL